MVICAGIFIWLGLWMISDSIDGHAGAIRGLTKVIKNNNSNKNDEVVGHGTKPTTPKPQPKK